MRESRHKAPIFAPGTAPHVWHSQVSGNMQHRVVATKDIGVEWINNQNEKHRLFKTQRFLGKPTPPFSLSFFHIWRPLPAVIICHEGLPGGGTLEVIRAIHLTVFGGHTIPQIELRTSHVLHNYSTTLDINSVPRQATYLLYYFFRPSILLLRLLLNVQKI